jgi:hypothetical protein
LRKAPWMSKHTICQSIHYAKATRRIYYSQKSFYNNGGRSQSATSISEQSNIERVISIVTTLIDNYEVIFPKDLEWSQFEDEDLKQVGTDFIGATTFSITALTLVC